MANGFTEEQKKAIETLDKSVLVSAAAGSGKTSVLIERIIRIILEGRANVDEMLVVTFTRAAASEMRERIGDAIGKALDKNPENEHLQKQLVLLNKASITTSTIFTLSITIGFVSPTFSSSNIFVISSRK